MAISSITSFNVSPKKSLKKTNQNAQSVSFGSAPLTNFAPSTVRKAGLGIIAGLATLAATMFGCDSASVIGPEPNPNTPVATDTAKTPTGKTDTSKTTNPSAEVIKTATALNNLLSAIGKGTDSNVTIAARIATPADIASVEGGPVPIGTPLQVNRSELNGFTKEYILIKVTQDGTYTFNVKSTNVNTGRVGTSQVNVNAKNSNTARVVSVDDPNDAIVLTKTTNGVTESDGITGEFIYTLSPMNNGNVAILNNDGIPCDTVSINTVTQR